MQKHYVVTKRVQFGKNGVLEIGDTLVFDSANGNKLSVYRNESLVINTTHTQIGVDSMEKCGMIAPVASPKPAAPVTFVATSTMLETRPGT